MGRSAGPAGLAQARHAGRYQFYTFDSETHSCLLPTEGGAVLRRLAAVVAVDVVGYSRQMAADEDLTLAAWMSLRALIDPVFEAGGARIVKSTGDGILVESPSVIEAARAALMVQETAESWNSDKEPAQRLMLRIGVNVGDIIVTDDRDIYGDGVNVAARLEALAEPGGICLSDAAYQQVRGRIDAQFRDRGEQW